MMGRERGVVAEPHVRTTSVATMTRTPCTPSLPGRAAGCLVNELTPPFSPL